MMKRVPHMPGLLHTATLSVYRAAAKVTGVYLGFHRIVESVYVHRSVATGEVSFGRSDIDLLVFVRQPDLESGDGPELASLYRWVILLRRFNPAVNHMAVQESSGLERSFRTDTYGGSVLRRSVIRLSGRPVVMPFRPIRREDAVRRFVSLPEGFLSPAVRQRNWRNLVKVAREMWNAGAVVRGWIPEPCLTQDETEARALDRDPGAGLSELARHPERALEFALRLAKEIHDDLLPRLKPLPQPLVFRMPLPPRSRHRVVVVLPEAGSPLPAEVFEPSSLLVTPEFLHLYLHHLNPFLSWTLPPELKRLGFVAPIPREYFRACVCLGLDFTTRFPGFLHEETWAPGTTAAFCEHSIPYLQNGEVPPAMPAETVRALMEHRPSSLEYYRHDFTRIYRQSAQQWRILDELESRFE